MTFRIFPVEKDDWPQLVSISHRAWGNEPIWNFLYPYLDTPEGTAQAISRLSQSFDQTPEVQWIKIIEQDSDKIVGAACWHFYPEDPYTRDGPGTGVNRRAKADWLGAEDNPTKQFFEFFYNEKRDRREEFEQLRRAHSCKPKFFILIQRIARKVLLPPLYDGGSRAPMRRALHATWRQPDQPMMPGSIRVKDTTISQAWNSGTNDRSRSDLRFHALGTHVWSDQQKENRLHSGYQIKFMYSLRHCLGIL
ncbi:MAG: hypothetical protein Q9165_003107 [Trypethelium subeluteriae]